MLFAKQTHTHTHIFVCCIWPALPLCCCLLPPLPAALHIQRRLCALTHSFQLPKERKKNTHTQLYENVQKKEERKRRGENKARKCEASHWEVSSHTGSQAVVLQFWTSFKLINSVKLALLLQLLIDVSYRSAYLPTYLTGSLPGYLCPTYYNCSVYL